MAKLTLTDLATLANETSAINTINNNNALTETALENTLSRDGTTPNTMGADIDMDSNDLLNVGVVNASQVKVGGVDASLLGDVTVRGAWLTATAYAQLNLVTEAGATYICLEAHTSGIFSTDLAAAKWAIIETSYDPAAVAITGGSITGVTGVILDTEVGSVVQAYDADTLKADTSDVLTAKFTTTPATDTGSGSETLDFSARGTIVYTLTGDVTAVALSGLVDGDQVEIWVIQDSTNRSFGGFTATGKTFQWATSDGAEPSVGTGSGNRTVYQFRVSDTVVLASAQAYL